jgi:adenylate cyclase
VRAMAEEIERKYLVEGAGWRSGPGTLYRQGYLCSDQARTVRVRVAGDRGFLTIKGETRGISRPEFEYAIPLADAEAMLEGLCARPLVEKTRHVVEHAGHTWEVDEFHGENAGLILAEVELSNADEVPALPPWVGAEVSSDPRYFNANLAKRPFRSW